MSSFKLSKRVPYSDQRSSVMKLHDEKLKYFENEYNSLPLLEKNLEELKSKSKYGSKEIANLEKKIQQIKNEENKIEYLLEFHLLQSNFVDNNNSENIIVTKFSKGKMDNFISSKMDSSKKKFYDIYVEKFNPELITTETYITNYNKCKRCNYEDVHYNEKHGADICINCGLVEDYIRYDESNIAYNDDIQQKFYFDYKRSNHFHDCLEQLQAREHTTIPKKIIEELTAELKKYNITDPSKLTPKLVKVYLKKLGYNKYYEHVPIIINELCGLPAPKISEELEQQLKVMFNEIQKPFEKYKKIYSPLRKNFLNYDYTLYKMLELLEKDEFLKCFSLLKSREKLYEHDQIWKGICKDLSWQFIPTI
jgi:hypothetical protein